MRGLYGNLLVPSKRALLFLEDFQAGDGPTRLKRLTGVPSRETVSISELGRTLDVDVYRPAEPARAGLLLVPGVAKGGKDDPRLLAFASTIARNGFAVVVPDLASLRQLIVRNDHYRDVAAAYHYMLSRPELAPGGRAGIGGLSFAMGPGLMAALDPAIRERVRFLFCIGGYHDILNVLTFVTTGCHREHERAPWQRLTPDHYGRWVLAGCLAQQIAHADSRQAIAEMIERRLPDKDADLADLEARVTDPAARDLLTLVNNTDREAVMPLFERLVAPMREELLSIDLASRDLSQLAARLILVHGYEDILVPYTESLALYRRMPASRARLYLVHGLGHVTLKKPGPLDAWALLSSVTALLREQER